MRSELPWLMVLPSATRTLEFDCNGPNQANQHSIHSGPHKGARPKPVGYKNWKCTYPYSLKW